MTGAAALTGQGEGLTDPAGLDAEEAALIARLPTDLRGAIFRPTDRMAPAARVAGLRRVVALYEGGWRTGVRDRLAALRDRHRGERLFVLGNGPSLRDVDLDRLAGQPSIGVNGLFLAFPETRFRPTYYLVEDHLVAEDRAEALNGLPAGLTRLWPMNLAYCLDDGPEVVWFDHRPRPGFPDRFDVSLDALERTFAGGTVVFTALQLAVFLGAREIVLLGVDLAYTLPADVQRLEGEGRAPGVLDMASDDPNHFHPDYFGKGKRWHDPNPGTMAEALATARDVLGAMGVRLINATPGGRMELMPRVPLPAMLKGGSEAAPLPRLLVFDLTPVGGASATGQLKAALMAPWRGGLCLTVTPDAMPDRFTVHRPDGTAESDLAPGAVLARVRAFAPEAVYYRPQPRRGHLHPLVLDWLEADPAPLVLHIMDDWLAPMETTAPLAWQVWRQDLDWLARRAAVRLAIGPSMAALCRDRHGGGPWQALANGIDAADWPERAPPPGTGTPFDLLFAGALAEDMNRAAVRDVAEAVDALNRAAGRLVIAFEVRVLPPWRTVARGLVSGLVGVTASVGDDPDPAAYRARLLAADGVLIAYAFDPTSRVHTRHSLANKLPEALASGAAVLGYGPADQATLAALADTGVALLVTERDPEALCTALARLIEDPALPARLGAAGRRLALEGYALAPRRAALVDVTRAAAEGRRVLSGDHPRLDGARLDEAALLLSLARFQTTAPGCLVDVGAHHGGFLRPFVEAGWSVLAVEPEPANRAALQARWGETKAVRVAAEALSDEPQAEAPLYTAPDSSGVATLAPFLPGHREAARVPVTTLAALLDRHGLETVDVLKVDVEGLDFRVLMGLDWERWRPRLVMAEFENAKTLPLGVSLGDLVALLEGRGYVVFVSEWHPVVRYGARHDWRRLIPWPPGDDDPLPDPDGWGNLIALRNDQPRPDDAALAGMVRAALTLDPRPEPTQDLDPPPLSQTPEPEPAPVPQASPSANPPSRRDKVRRLALEVGGVLGSWRAPLAGGLVAAGVAVPLLPPLAGAVLSGAVVAALLGMGAYGSVRARRLDAIDREAMKARLDARLKRHVGWLRDDLAGLRNDLARDLARLAEDESEARDRERLAREAADRHVEAALTRHMNGIRDALGEALDDTRRRQARDTRGLAASLAELRADLSRENAARDAAWQAAVDEAERAAARGDAKTVRQARADLTEQRQVLTAGLTAVRSRLEARGATAAPARLGPFSRGLDDADVDRLLTHWAPALGLSDLTRPGLGHLAGRLLALEQAGGGRLACALPAAVLRALVARAAPGGTVRGLEVGVLFGLGLATLHQGAAGAGRPVRLMGVDPWPSEAAPDPFTGTRPDARAVRVRLRQLGLGRGTVSLVRRPSRDALTQARARAFAGAAGLSVLVLDGCHDRAGLTEDWAAYAPLLRPGGLAVIDDCGATAWPEVAPVVHDIAAATPGFTLLGIDWHTAVLRREAAS